LPGAARKGEGDNRRMGDCALREEPEPDEREAPVTAHGQGAIAGGRGFVADEAGSIETDRVDRMFRAAEAIRHLAAMRGRHNFPQLNKRLPATARGII